MRSALDASAWLLALAVGLGAAGDGHAAAGEPLSRQQVQSAAERVGKDPDLATTISEKTLRLKDRDTKPEKNGTPELEWLIKFMRWLSETTRLLMWLAGALAVALLLVGLRRWIRARSPAAAGWRSPLPSHVQSLDIRPESLPDDVGQAAASLWQRGEHRAALSLLYRGALSRLVHDHAVPIRAASTEGECVALAARCVDAVRAGFFVRLVAAWQLAVYGARMPPADQALQLCRDFDIHLAPRGTVTQ